MTLMTNPETLRGKLQQMREERDYWRKRATQADAELRMAARCVRAMLSARKDAAKWLALFDARSA